MSSCCTVEGGSRKSWQVLHTSYPSQHRWELEGHVQGFFRITVSLSYDCLSLSHQVWEGWMWSRVPQPWVYRREPTLPCGVISPPSQTMCSGSIWPPGAASSVCFTFLQGQSRMEDWTPWQSLQNATAHCMFPLHRPQTQALTSVLCSVVLPKHLQPVLKPSAGLSPSSRHSHIMTPLPGICSV